jgi:hypothetical protein
LNPAYDTIFQLIGVSSILFALGIDKEELNIVKQVSIIIDLE